MKYGIRLDYHDGSYEYAASARNGYLSSSRDFSDIALFSSKESAIKSLKACRKNGIERTHNCELTVIAIEFTVTEVTTVKKKPVKSGWLITRHDCSPPKLFSGPLKADSHLSWDIQIERATVFPSQAAASAKIQEIAADNEAKVAKLEREVDSPASRYHWPDTTQSKEQRRVAAAAARASTWVLDLEVAAGEV